MTADEIRGQTCGTMDQTRDFFLAEIAAQLAELNATLNRVYPPQKEFTCVTHRIDHDGVCPDCEQGLPARSLEDDYA